MIILRDSRKVNTLTEMLTPMVKKSQRPRMEAGLLHRLSYCRILITIRLKQLRVTDKQIADLVADDWGEVPSNSSINQIFAGMQKDITTRQAAAIAKAAGVDTGWLVTGQGNAPPGYVAPIDGEGGGAAPGAPGISKGPTPKTRHGVPAKKRRAS